MAQKVLGQVDFVRLENAVSDIDFDHLKVVQLVLEFGDLVDHLRFEQLHFVQI